MANIRRHLPVEEVRSKCIIQNNFVETDFQQQQKRLMLKKRQAKLAVNVKEPHLQTQSSFLPSMHHTSASGVPKTKLSCAEPPAQVSSDSD